jgi:PAS domain-containing protein
LKRTEPLPLDSCRVLRERARHFEHGHILDFTATDLSDLAVKIVLGRNSAGWWECDLTDNSLTWTTGIYDIFGLPQGARVTRDEAVALYCEQSRAVMERMRAFAIGQRRSFTLDAEIRPANGEPNRWMRLIGAPVCDGGRTIGLHGLKLIV